MSTDEFLKQQYLTLREEIRASKTRVFVLLVLVSIFVPSAAFAASMYGEAYSSAALPFILLVLMLAFLTEQNAIVRAGRYLKEHVEPKADGLVTWENWLESNHAHRNVDRYYFASFLIVFMLFYAIGTGLAIESLATRWTDNQWIYASAGYGVGGLWFILVWLRHWRACTTTS